jgi:2-oxo-4-hydroxy-4-carboxy--5-ureidoimidazoline (OHCU) decarboxylase
MKKASEYRQHAEECRALAVQMDRPEQRDQMLAMAEHWEKLAADRLELIRKHPELAQPGEQEEARSDRAGCA